MNYKTGYKAQVQKFLAKIILKIGTIFKTMNIRYIKKLWKKI